MSWHHEVDMYNTCLLRHPNILCFITSDIVDGGMETQLWIVLEYCQLGSLYDVLVGQTLDEATVIKLCLIAANKASSLRDD